MEVKRPIIELARNFIVQAKNSSDGFLRPCLLHSNDARNDSFLSPAQFGCLTGLLIILISNFQFERNKSLSRLRLYLTSPSFKDSVFTTTCFLVSMMFMPIVVLIVAAFRIYKAFDGVKLRQLEGANFKGFMNGEDIVWACEDATSKSIINVLAFVRPETETDENLPGNLLLSMRQRISTKLMETNRFPKMFYRRRKSNSGFFYWTDENTLTINDYVRFSKDVERVTSEENFKEEMSGMSNEPLPAGNTALWECLIGQQGVLVGDDLKYPVRLFVTLRVAKLFLIISFAPQVIFRVHHSVGDGIALLRLLLESLADKEEINVTGEDSISSRRVESLKERIVRYTVNLVTFFKMPSVLFLMATKEIDVNKLHPQRLTGNKVGFHVDIAHVTRLLLFAFQQQQKVNWLYESDSGNYPTLMSLVKLLKRQFDSGRFSNILLAALSKSLKDFFERKHYEIPKDMTVVIPARLCNSREDPQLRMENRFSVAMQTLPIDENRIYDRINRIRRCSEVVSASPDYLVNYWMMTFVSAIFPEPILKVVMNSKHTTMAVSNLPGPNFAIKINGHELESLGFFLPNLGTTACGITILSYNNKLHFGIMADEAAVKNESDLWDILQGMVREIKVMTENILL